MAKKPHSPIYLAAEESLNELTALLSDVSNALNFAANLDSLNDTRTDVKARVDLDSAADVLLSDAREKAQQCLALVERIESVIGKGGRHG